MDVYVNEITGIADAIVSMFMSKRSWTRETELDIRNTCERVLTCQGKIAENVDKTDLDKYNRWMDSLLKWGWRHITMLRFIDISVTVEGLHRAGQDDWDSHAARFNNRISRSSTRRGLYMLSIPSNFIFKVNLTEWAHVYKERNAQGAANPEVKMCCEEIAEQITGFQPRFDRELFLKIKN